MHDVIYTINILYAMYISKMIPYIHCLYSISQCLCTNQSFSHVLLLLHNIQQKPRSPPPLLLYGFIERLPLG